MKLILTALIASTLFASVTPALAQKEVKKPVKDYVVAKFDGKELRFSEVLETWESLFPGGNAPEFENFDANIRQNVLRGLVSEKLIYQEALEAGYDKNPDVAKKLKEVEKQLIMQGFVESKGKKMISDAELKAAYEERIKGAKGEEEVSARHILVKTEDEAKAIAKQLKEGAKFEELAKEKSTDKASGARGGDLGWFTKDRMIPEFSEAAFALKKGTISAPVKSGFGWHIIKLEDRRKVQPPSFEESKETLQAELSEKAIESYISNLLDDASVKYYDAKGKEIKLDAKPAAADGEEEAVQ